MYKQIFFFFVCSLDYIFGRHPYFLDTILDIYIYIYKGLKYSTLECLDSILNKHKAENII